MKKYIIGTLIGSALTVSATAGAAAVKQYILTEISYPVVVNGKEFKDATAPILNYEGSTYVPLAKLGDITGVNYKWNEAAKQVEIVTGNAAASSAGSQPAGSGDVTTKIYDKTTGKLRDVEAILAEEEAIRKVIEKPILVEDVKSRFVEAQGSKYFQAYDLNGKDMGRFGDGNDVAQIDYDIQREIKGGTKTANDPRPPKFSDGWVHQYFLAEIFKYAVTVDNSTATIKSADGKELARITLPADWSTKTSGEATVNNVKLKKYDTYTYFNIADLQAAGVIK